MLEKKVEQSNTLNYIKDYNSHWENMVSKIVEDIYVSGPAFKSAYASNSKKVFKRINSKMKVSPIDLKETIHAFYMRMVPQMTPDDGPRRGVA
jgi:hypothetical protein